MSKELSSFSKRFFSGTMLSRISGFLRDLIMAFVFGDHPSVAAFFIAFRLANLFRRLLGEGPFQSAFIPHFEGVRLQDPLKASFFFQRLSFLMILILLIITAFSETALYFLGSLFNFSLANQEIITLTALLFPGLIFICLYGLNISLLQCFDSFFIPSFAPFVCNVIWIIGALILKNLDPTLAMRSLCLFIFLGFFFQWLFTLPLTLKYVSGNLKDWFSFSIPGEVKKLFKSFMFGAIGVGAVQINAFLDAIFARAADLSGPVYLWYSIRLEQLALAIFGIVCVSTIVPRLSRAIKTKNNLDAIFYYSYSLKRIINIMIPCSFAIFALGGSAINLLYGKGQFSNLAVIKTTLCLWSYTFGLLPSTLVILLSSVFYAKDNFRSPTLFSLISIIFNVLLNIIFVFGMKMGAVSTALATSLSSWLNFWILSYYLKDFEKKSHETKEILKILQVSFLATIFTLGVEYLLFKTSILSLFSKEEFFFTHSLQAQLLNFFALSLVFSFSLFIFAKIFKSKDFLEIVYEYLPKRRSSFESNKP